MLRFFFEKSPEASAKARDHMLEVLFERMRDVNAYTRSKTLQTWSKLVQLRFYSFPDLWMMGFFLLCPPFSLFLQ